MNDKFQISSSRQLLTAYIIAHFESSSDPGILSYSKIADYMRRDLGSIQWMLTKSIEDASEAMGINLDRERGEGIKRMDDVAAAEIAASGARSIKRKANRAAKRQMQALGRASGLSDSDKNRAIANAVVLKSVAELVKPRRIEAVEKAANAQGGQLPVGRVVELLNK